jgi:uncharacterized caspase-like protein
MLRSTIRVSLLGLCLILISRPLARADSHRTALVIGNAAYRTSPLRNAVNDATDMAAALQRFGFEVTTLRDADRRSMIEALETFSKQLRQGGVGLFYFAGHGVQVGGENYLVPVDARINREQDVPFESMHVGRVLGVMEDAGNDLNVVILDACRDNPFAHSSRSSSRGLAVVQAARGSLIAYATAPGSVAADGDGSNGIYTQNLLKAMATPGLSIERMFKQVRLGVVEATHGKQTPWESSSLVGDFSFVPTGTTPPPAVTAAPAPAAHPPTATGAMRPLVPEGPDPEAELWALVKESTHSEDISYFLEQYPRGRFAPHARLRLQQLQRTEAAVPATPSTPPTPAAPATPPAPAAPAIPDTPRQLPPPALTSLAGQWQGADGRIMVVNASQFVVYLYGQMIDSGQYAIQGNQILVQSQVYGMYPLQFAVQDNALITRNLQGETFVFRRIQ